VSGALSSVSEKKAMTFDQILKKQLDYENAERGRKCGKVIIGMLMDAIFGFFCFGSVRSLAFYESCINYLCRFQPCKFKKMLFQKMLPRHTCNNACEPYNIYLGKCYNP
jgi:hypothetical protein